MGGRCGSANLAAHDALGATGGIEARLSQFADVPRRNGSHAGVERVQFLQPRTAQEGVHHFLAKCDAEAKLMLGDVLPARRLHRFDTRLLDEGRPGSRIAYS